MTFAVHVILDRDGVLDREPAEGWLTDRADWVWEDGALDGLDALAALAADGVAVSVATNQSGIGRGAVSAAEVSTLHEWLARDLRARGLNLVGIFTCPHAPDDGCRCRKPAPGLVLDAVAASGVPPEQTVFVGDAERDVVAARAAGVEPLLVRTGKGRETERQLVDGLEGVVVLDDLVAVAALMARRCSPG